MVKLLVHGQLVCLLFTMALYCLPSSSMIPSISAMPKPLLIFLHTVMVVVNSSLCAMALPALLVVLSLPTTMSCTMKWLILQAMLSLLVHCPDEPVIHPCPDCPVVTPAPPAHSAACPPLSILSDDQGDLLIHGLWYHGTVCTLDVHITDTCQNLSIQGSS